MMACISGSYYMFIRVCNVFFIVTQDWKKVLMNVIKVQNVKFSLAQDFVYNAFLAGRIGCLNILVCPACCTNH